MVTWMPSPGEVHIAGVDVNRHAPVLRQPVYRKLEWWVGPSSRSFLAALMSTKKCESAVPVPRAIFSSERSI